MERIRRVWRAVRSRTFVSAMLLSFGMTQLGAMAFSVATDRLEVFMVSMMMLVLNVAAWLLHSVYTTYKE